MTHPANDYGFSDSVRRQQRERLGWQQPLCEDVQTAPLRHFALAGAGIGALIMLYVLGVL